MQLLIFDSHTLTLKLLYAQFLLYLQIEQRRPGVDDVCDNVVGLFKNPVVTPGYGVVRVDGLDPLWEHCVRVVIVFCFLAKHIG